MSKNPLTTEHGWSPFTFKAPEPKTSDSADFISYLVALAMVASVEYKVWGSASFDSGSLNKSFNGESTPFWKERRVLSHRNKSPFRGYSPFSRHPLLAPISTSGTLIGREPRPFPQPPHYDRPSHPFPFLSSFSSVSAPIALPFLPPQDITLPSLLEPPFPSIPQTPTRLKRTILVSDATQPRGRTPFWMSRR